MERIVCSMTILHNLHNKNAIHAALFAGDNAGVPGYEQEHLHQASLVLQPKTDLSSRVKLASRLLPGLCSSMAGSKCKQVLYLPAAAVQTLKVHSQPNSLCERASLPCVKLYTCCKLHIFLCKPSQLHECRQKEMQCRRTCAVCGSICSIRICRVAGLKSAASFCLDRQPLCGTLCSNGISA